MISVVTPVKNGILFVSECLASVRKAADSGLVVEHIVVDGGSTDGTLERIGNAAGISLLSVPGESALDSTMRGIAAARGRYVLLLMSDDVLNDGLKDLARQAGIDGSESPDLVLASANWSDARLVPVRDARGDLMGLPPRRYWTVFNGYPGLNSALFRPNLLSSFTVPPTLPQTNDRMMMLVLLTRARNAFVSDLPIVQMRHHAGSMTMSASRDVSRLKAEMVELATLLRDSQSAGPERDAVAAFLAKAKLSVRMEQVKNGTWGSRRVENSSTDTIALGETLRGVSALLAKRDRFADDGASLFDEANATWRNRMRFSY